MNVLIGFEESQRVCMEFRKRGHEAFSCDLKPCGGGYNHFHLQMDIMKAITLRKWDFIGLHPVCTKIALSGNAFYGNGKPKNSERKEAVEWTIALWNLACSLAGKVYMENPLGAMNNDNRLPGPQIIQPFYFGDKVRKPTCLWLYGLPKLVWARNNTLFEETAFVEPDIIKMKSKKTGRIRTYSKWEYEASCDQQNRKEVRSKTFPGIAKAMADQWG